MTWEHRSELRADPGSAPGERNIETQVKRSSIWPSIAVVVAAAAFGGVIWFAYKNGRESSGGGQPPLVKAEPGPVKIKPDPQAGADAQSPESPVYGRLESVQTQNVEKILPAPEAPLPRPAPASESGAGGAGGTQTAGSPIPDALPPASDSSPTVLAPPPGALTIPPPARAMPGTLKTAPGPIAVRAPDRPSASAPVSPGDEAKAKSPAKRVDVKPAPVSSIAALESRALADAPPAKADGTHGASAIHGSGSYRIQLSAVRTEDAANADWTRLKHRFPELSSLSQKSVKTEIPGKGTFYRLRAGPLDEAGAKSVCDHLQAQGASCIVLKP